jgi:hypothetical protein
MRWPAGVEDVRVVVIGDWGAQKEGNRVDCEEELAEHFQSIFRFLVLGGVEQNTMMPSGRFESTGSWVNVGINCVTRDSVKQCADVSCRSSRGSGSAGNWLLTQGK